MCDARWCCTLNVAGLPAAVTRSLDRRTANHRLLDGLARACIGHKHLAAVVLDGNSIDILHGLPRASPLHQHLILAPDGATQQHTHDLSWRGHISVNPAALPLDQALVDAGALTATHH